MNLDENALEVLEEQLSTFPFGWEQDYGIPPEARAGLEMVQWELLHRAEHIGVEAVRLYRDYLLGG